MAGLGIDGLVSGLKTSDLIDNLMRVEANQQTMLKVKQSNATSLVTALQSLNTKVASLGSAAKNAAKDVSWQAVKATSSEATVATASTGEGAAPSTLQFRVDAVAASQSTMYSLPASYSDTKPSFTLTVAGKPTTITALSSNIGDVVAAFNAEGTGVKASAINVGTADAPDYRLQVTGTQSGKANVFTLTADNGAANTSMTAQTIRSASDAELVLWPGTDAQSRVYSATNVFTNLASGVTVTAVKTSADPVTVTVARDTNALSNLASGLVNNLNAVLSEIGSRSKTTTGKASDGGEIVTGGLFSGNTAIRLLQQDLQRAGSQSVGDMTAASVGIVLGKDGSFTFDATAFSEALTKDPAAVQKVVTGLSNSLQEAATAASDEVKGSLTTQITASQGEVKDLGDRITSWDLRLETRRAALTRTYAQLEVSLSNMQSQSAWLSSQIQQMNSNNG